jgi:hypothetical protein
MTTADKTTNPVTVTLTHEISESRIRDLFCNAIEGGSNYWCNSMDRKGNISREQAPYRQDVPFVEGGWLDVRDDDGGKHRVDREAIVKGLKTLAEKYPKHFADFLSENDDAETGDVFLQCICFGEVIYG